MNNQNIQNVLLKRMIRGPKDFHSSNRLLIPKFVQLYKVVLLLNAQRFFHLFQDLIRQLHRNRIKNFLDFSPHIKVLVLSHTFMGLKLSEATLVPILNKPILKFPVLKKQVHQVVLAIF
jgi:hypothetical protein